MIAVLHNSGHIAKARQGGNSGIQLTHCTSVEDLYQVYSAIPTVYSCLQYQTTNLFYLPSTINTIGKEQPTNPTINASKQPVKYVLHRLPPHHDSQRLHPPSNHLRQVSCRPPSPTSSIPGRPPSSFHFFMTNLPTNNSSQNPPTQGILLPTNPISYYAPPPPPPPPPPIILGLPVQTTVTTAVCFPPPPPPPAPAPAPPVVVAGMPWPVTGLPLRVAP